MGLQFKMRWVRKAYNKKERRKKAVFLPFEVVPGFDPVGSSAKALRYESQGMLRCLVQLERSVMEEWKMMSLKQPERRSEEF